MALLNELRRSWYVERLMFWLALEKILAWEVEMNDKDGVEDLIFIRFSCYTLHWFVRQAWEKYQDFN